ncbi:hypothetical protein PO78_3331 [Thauera sp. SWB20]|nr:hypothetical protein PO78_3331 [Thauera sp. SWB20]
MRCREHGFRPLISGHQSGPSERLIIVRFKSLNPFDIRASVRTYTPDELLYPATVSIPLISGHQSGRVKTLHLSCASMSQSL